jgi:hypothetical protein
VPVWFTSRNWGADITLMQTNLFSSIPQAGFSTVYCGEFTVRVSSAERAIMEMLYCVPGTETAEETEKIFEGLITLRPDVVSGFLAACTSVKVKRLFMVLAERFNHPWLDKVDITGVDFGKGKRSIFRGGYFDKRYNITIPADWHSAEVPQRP